MDLVVSAQATIEELVFSARATVVELEVSAQATVVGLGPSALASVFPWTPGIWSTGDRPTGRCGNRFYLNYTTLRYKLHLHTVQTNSWVQQPVATQLEAKCNQQLVIGNTHR